MAKYKAYPEYKSSKVNYLGDIPKEWKLIKFGITNSSAELGGNYLASEGEQGIAVIKMGNLGRGVVNLARIERIPLNEKYDTHHLLKAGDFLFNTRNSLELVGKVSVWREELEHAIYNSNILRITFDKKFVDSTDFISYLFNSDRALSQLRLIAKGTTSVAAIYYKDLSSLVFAFPPVREQAKIADFLDFETAQIDTLIEKQQTLIQLLKEKRQAVISHAVTKGLNPDAPMKDSGVEWLGEVPEHWEQVKLKHIVDSIIDAEHKTAPYFEQGKYLVCRTTNVRNGELRLEGGKYTNEETYLEWIKRGRPEIGDILFTREAPAGEACVYDGAVPLCLGQRMVLFKLKKDRVLPTFVLHSIYSGLADDFIKQLSQGSTVAHFNMADIRNIPLFEPSLAEQQEIVEYLSKLLNKFDDLVYSAEKAIQLMQERRTALISAAVTGKIDVRGWVAPESR